MLQNMRRRLDDSGTPSETILGTYRSTSLSPPGSRTSRSLVSVSNITSVHAANNVHPYSVNSSSYAYDLAGISNMPSLTICDEMSSSNGITVRSTSVETITPLCAGNKLKVEDALQYLDRVKLKFRDQPCVYNAFLDIMKDFKHQNIDTPGVINRVAYLFKIHPELISGFNTFLPPGYKIEVQSNDNGYAEKVSISQPSPTTPFTIIDLDKNPDFETKDMHCAPAPQPPEPIMNDSLNLVSGQPIVNKTSHSIPSSTNTMIPPAVNSNPVPNNVIPNQTSRMSAMNHQYFNQAQAQQAVSDALIHVETGHSPPHVPNQPVEFNHAISYVNKIKKRFLAQPDKYKRFLEILHTYQKEQHTLKENHSIGNQSGRTLTEAEVYSQVAKLFENQEDLLKEFGQFLPDATAHQSSARNNNSEYAYFSRRQSVGSKPCVYNSGACTPSTIANNSSTNSNSNSNCPTYTSKYVPVNVSTNAVPSSSSSAVAATPPPPAPHFGGPNVLKRSSSFSNSHSNKLQPPFKKFKLSSLRSVTITEASKYATLTDYTHFDRIRKTLRSHEMYKNFLRCLYIYNNEIISRSELIHLTSPFLSVYPDLFKWFKDFLGQNNNNNNNNLDMEISHNNQISSHETKASRSTLHMPLYNEPKYSSRSGNYSRQDRSYAEHMMDIDYSTCKRIGASYCAVPDDFVQPKCSGRTLLCHEVLNDTWVSFPTWSEDSTFVSSRKTQYEEHIYRCEDERFELDVVLETNDATIRVLDTAQRKMSRLSSDEVSKFVLDDCLGGSSPTIHKRAIRRIYGDKALDVIDGLKRTPSTAIPIVLKRLKTKAQEWREAQKAFNKIWREQNEKYYLKSLDYQGINFKQNDMKYLRSKSLLNEIEALYDERHEEFRKSNFIAREPHLTLPYRDKSMLDDAANLLIHHVKRQTTIHKEEKQKIKSLIRQFLPDLFGHPRQELSDDEKDEIESKDDIAMEDIIKLQNAGSDEGDLKLSPLQRSEEDSENNNDEVDRDSDKIDENLPEDDFSIQDEDIKVPLHAMSAHPEEHYTLFLANNSWYLFFRLHQILCDRLSQMYERANYLIQEESNNTTDNRKDSVAIALRLKPKLEIEVEDYYNHMLTMVKNVLDGNLDCTTYEDTLREMFGIFAYIGFTLDKVVSHAVRQLQVIITDRSSRNSYNLFLRETKKNATGGLCVTAYQRVSAEINYQKKAESMKNCFKLFIYKINSKITIECLGARPKSDDNQDSEKASYIESGDHEKSLDLSSNDNDKQELDSQ